MFTLFVFFLLANKTYYEIPLEIKIILHTFRAVYVPYCVIKCEVLNLLILLANSLKSSFNGSYLFS